MTFVFFPLPRTRSRFERGSRAETESRWGLIVWPLTLARVQAGPDGQTDAVGSGPGPRLWYMFSWNQGEGSLGFFEIWRIWFIVNIREFGVFARSALKDFSLTESGRHCARNGVNGVVTAGGCCFDPWFYIRGRVCVYLQRAFVASNNKANATEPGAGGAGGAPVSFLSSRPPWELRFFSPCYIFYRFLNSVARRVSARFNQIKYKEMTKKKCILLVTIAEDSIG